MRNSPLLIVFAILLLLWLLLGSFFQSRYCSCGATAAASTAAVVPVVPAIEEEEKISPYPIAIQDEEINFKAGTNENLLFAPNECTYLSPISEPLTEVFSDAVQHLQDNAKRILVLTGFYKPSEDNTCTDTKNLGIGRASQVKDMLVAMGAPDAQIRVQSEQKEELITLEDNIIGGVDYHFISGDIEEVETRLRQNNITLYFDTNQQDLNLNPKQQEYFDDLKFYLQQKTNAKVNVTGFTDDRGEEKYNQRLSRKRAEFVRDYMALHDIDPKQIIAVGKGPSDPIDTNDTREGRAKNRRVEVRIRNTK